MTRFPDHLDTRKLRRDDFARRGVTHQHEELLAPFAYRSDLVGTLHVPAEFLTDLGSVPPPAWWIVPGNGPDLTYPSIPHDYLYFCQGKLPDGRRYTRQTADQVLREAMRDVGAPRWRIACVYYAVRAFGWMRWNRAS